MVMIIIQNLLIPFIVDIGAQASDGVTGGFSAGQDNLGATLEKVTIDFSSPILFFKTMGLWLTSLRGVFLMLALIQGLFAGLVMGKLAEGELTPGIKHSLILMTIAFFIISLAQGAMG